ncbi:DUF4824 family protein [Alteromonas sp. KUL49]|uniref:DUF4824 family protein n=1 Tax=Alteromonas sp. KUL49 TaxID=2480798 RepID=UPI00102F1F57|nr:DUF4824 family protein [Alteromonas sp. KUL49]TAP40835.1 DUF4824 family protein [Alteromonas sp. KUL49]GEA11013.1 DUF4824 domain-containing protein [Alteromonas sp. KUL49]
MFERLKTNAFLILAVLLLIVNGFVLATVVSNKQSVLSELVLTERELTLSYKKNENSGRFLRIKYRALNDNVGLYVGSYSRLFPKWLTEEKLIQLGFVINNEDTDDTYIGVYDKKEVYIALEYDGEAYVNMLSNVEAWYEEQLLEEESPSDRERFVRRLAKERDEASRLFVIDAETSLDVLLSRYDGAENIMYAKAIVSVSKPLYGDNRGHGFVGFIEQLAVENINLALPYSHTLGQLPLREYDQVNPPRYRVSVSVGSQLSPFVTDVSLMSD